LEDFGTGGRIIISILNKEWNGFIWFVIGRSDSCCANGDELPDFITCGTVLH
jgi:hypothetical protein